MNRENVIPLLDHAEPIAYKIFLQDNCKNTPSRMSCLEKMDLELETHIKVLKEQEGLCSIDFPYNIAVTLGFHCEDEKNEMGPEFMLVKVYVEKRKDDLFSWPAYADHFSEPEFIGSSWYLLRAK